MICDKCLRLIYISFDLVKNYISTKCPYCNKFDVYSYSKFLEILQKNNNPLLNNFCFICLKNLNYSEKINFFLLETKDDFFIVCGNCIENKKCQNPLKKIELKKIIEHDLSIYEKNNNNNLEQIKNLENIYSNEYKENIINNLKILEDFEKKLNILELINNKNIIKISLRNKAEKKINELKKILKIKKIIIEQFHLIIIL